MAREIPVTEARAEFAELINQVGYGGERVVITRHGKPLVAMVPVSAADDVDNVTVLDLSSRSQGDPTRTYGVAAEHTNDRP